MNRKKAKQIHTIARRCTQLFFFIAFPSLFTAAFSGVKYLFNQFAAGAPVELTSFLSALIAICVYTIVLGRFFCGYACAFGSFGDFLHGVYRYVCKKRKKRALRFPQKADWILTYVKYIVLAAIVLMCFFGVYAKFSGTSPWEVFSMLRALRPKWQGYAAGWVILIVLMVGMTVRERFFCRFFCPLGAVFSLLPVLPLFSLHRDRPACREKCGVCTRICPSSIELPSYGDLSVKGDCFQCGKCLDVCPQTNITTGIRKIKGNEIFFLVVRVAVLTALCVWLHV
jgi:polyferredoxin